MSEINYVRAQARWLAKKFPTLDFDVDSVETVQFIYEEGYSYSSYTFSDGRFEVRLELRDGSVKVKSFDGDQTIDLAQMVVEGLEMELNA